LSRRTIPLATLVALLASAFAAAPAGAIPLSPPEPHSPNAEAIHSTYWVMFVIGLILVVAVNGALLAAVLKFRERRGRRASRVVAGRGALRPVVGGLSVLALVIFVYGVVRTDDVRTVEPTGPDGLNDTASAQVGVRGVPPVSIDVGSEQEAAQETTSSDAGAGAPLQIDATAQQWLWRFEYPNVDVNGRAAFSYGELVVPVDTAVVLNITSIDVLHSWWVPALGGQVQASPGTTVQTWFKADEVGTYSGQSTIFSGTGTPAMRSWVRVVSVPDYQAYTAQLAKDLETAQNDIQSAAQASAAETP